MNFKQVEAFRAVMLSGSMTSAAKEMFTSQPNISRLIAQLELRTGFKLFERHAGRLIPTPEAESLFKDVERAFVGLDTIERSIANIQKRSTGHLRIASAPSIALTILPETLDAFVKIFPDAQVSIHIADSRTVAKWVASRYCDIGIASFITDRSGLKVSRLETFKAVCIVPANHRLANKQSPITLSDFKNERFFSLPEGDETRKQIDRLFYDAGAHRLDMYECPYSASICTMVGRGMGISIVNPMIATHFLHTGIVIKEMLPAPEFPYYSLSPSLYPASQLAIKFNELLTKNLSDPKNHAYN